MNGRILLLILFACLVASGCKTPRIVQLSADTYMAARSSSAGAFADTSKLKLKVIEDANEFARSKGKVAVAINSREIRPAVGFPSYEYQFRLVDPDDPAAKGAALDPAPDILIESK